jgi:hypothetical protein
VSTTPEETFKMTLVISVLSRLEGASDLVLSKR